MHENSVFSRVEELYCASEIKFGVDKLFGCNFNGQNLLFIDGRTIIDFMCKNNISDDNLNEETEATVMRYNIMINEKISDRISSFGTPKLDVHREIRFRKDGVCISHFNSILTLNNMRELPEYDFVSNVSVNPYEYLFDWILRIENNKKPFKEKEIMTYNIRGNNARAIVGTRSDALTRWDVERMWGLR